MTTTMDIVMHCVCGASDRARVKRAAWAFTHAHRFCGGDELLPLRRKRRKRAGFA